MSSKAGAKAKIGELMSEAQGILRECEHKIDQCLDDAWHALRRIHDEKLYKSDGYPTFKDYVEQRWGYSKSRAHQLMDHSKIVDYLKAEGVTFLPGGEGLTRPLSKLRRTSKNEEAFLQKAANAWQIASDMAPKAFDVPQVTTGHVEETMKQFGFHRNPKKTSEAAAVLELRTLLTKLTQCEAMKVSGYDFVKKHGSKAFPNQFHELVNWLTECAEVAEIK